ncbi:MAG: hypothetical protein E3J64_01395 [Anaerolineales bacterium]|nr:MAG: hypothetical protein E3J64_01395 [Anaerolineales bacterium]
MRRTKQPANTLTCVRVLLTVCLAWRGALRSARRTWVGEHDADADLSASLGVLSYLVFSGYVPTIALLLGLLIVALWVLASYQLGWPLYADPLRCPDLDRLRAHAGPRLARSRPPDSSHSRDLATSAGAVRAAVL